MAAADTGGQVVVAISGFYLGLYGLSKVLSAAFSSPKKEAGKSAPPSRKILNSQGQLTRSLKPARCSRTPAQTLGGDPSPRQTSIGKNSHCVMKSGRGALVRGSDPP